MSLASGRVSHKATQSPHYPNSSNAGPTGRVEEIFYCRTHELTVKATLGNLEEVYVKTVDCLMYREIDNDFH